MTEIIRVGFAENTGTTAADSSGNGRNITSVPGWAASQSGHGTALSRSTAGTGGQFTLAADLTEWTMMFWVRVRSTGTWASIVEQPFFGVGELFIEVNGLALDVYHRWVASGGDYSIASGTLTAATWTHLAYTYNATTNVGRVVINGTTNGTSTADNALLKTGGTYYIGGSPSQPGNMDVDDFRLFNVGMTDGEIAAVMAESVEGGSSNAGTLTGGLPRLTATITGQSVNAGSLAGTLPRLAGQIISTDTNPGTLAASLPLVTGAVSGQSVNLGTLTATLPKVASAVTGTAMNPGTLTAALPRITAVLNDISYRWITATNGRYFVDQYGDPILVKGESPWGAPTKMSTTEWATYCADRASRGFNAALVSLIGCGIIGANDNGATYDGILPFTGGNVTTPNETYWSRMDTFLDIAEAHGITVFAYPIDGWTVLTGRVFDGISATDCQTFGAWLATRWAGRPNIVWMFGGDYPGGTATDNQMGGCLAGIRSTGDTRPVSCQMMYQRTWTGQYAYWKSRADFWHIYSYPVQYDATYAAYNDAGDEATVVPALFMEGSYGGENDGSAALTIRKQAAWAMTQGSPGHFYGSADWLIPSGWQSRLGSYSVADVARIHAAVGSVAWWKLQPSRTFITSGAGTLLDASGIGAFGSSDGFNPSDSDYATAAISADKSLALVYLPTQRAITIDTSQLGGSPVGTWIATATLAETSAGSLAGSITPPAAGDWLLRIEAEPEAITGTLTGTLPKVTGQLTGQSVNPGALSATLPKITSSVSGGSANPATLNASTPGLTGAITGTATNSGTLTGTLPVLRGLVSDASLNIGTLTATLPRVTGLLTGEPVNPATLAAAAPKLTGSCAGAMANPATLLASVPRITAEITGTTGSVDATPVQRPQLTLALPRSAAVLAIPTSRAEITPMDGYTRNDTGPDLTMTLTSTPAQTFTGATVAVHVRKPGGQTLTKTPQDFNTATGVVTIRWVAGDLDKAGLYEAECQVTYSNGQIQTFGPASFVVRDELG